MAVRCSVYIAASLDGFIARPDGDVEWLNRPEYASPDSFGLSYEAFIATVDALVMGRKTFEKVLTFSSWPYGGLPVVVLSRQEVAIPGHLSGQVTVDGGNPAEITMRLEAAGMAHLYVDGGVTIQRFLQSGLITEITITRIPVLLGAGIALFGSLDAEIPLQHLGTTTSSNGFVQSRYQVARPTG